MPSVGRLEVPAILLCSAVSAPVVNDAIADLGWARVEVQEQWRGGWTGAGDEVITRVDSDDALHGGWFKAVEAAPAAAEVVCTKEFLRCDPGSGRLCAYRRGVSAPLAAFRGGRSPFEFDHAELEGRYRVHFARGAYLQQVFHGGNLSSRRPSWYRRRLPLERLRAFGLDPKFLNR